MSILHLQTPDWQDLANCRDAEERWFFPPDGVNTQGYYEIGRGICRRCDVQDECLSYALEADERYGLWGGKSPGERAKMQLVRVRHFTPKGCGTEAAHTRHVRAGEEPCELCKAARSEALSRRRGA